MKAKMVYVPISLALAMGLALAVSAVSVSAQSPVDSVDIGNTTSEATHNLQGWGPPEPDTHGGSWGQLASGGYPDYTSVDNKCKVTWWDNEGDNDPYDEGSDNESATFELYTGSGMTATDLLLRVLDGQGDDSFKVYVNNNLVMTYADQYSTETWVTHNISISSLSATGTLIVKVEAMGPKWSSWTTYGQLGVDRAELYAEETSEQGGCFIATAAYGTSTTEEIDVLRAFRDEVLLESVVGSQLVEWYYQTSPPVADFMSGNSALRTIVRELVIDPMVSVATFTQGVWGK